LRENPFRPGAGSPPPYLAGRKDAKDALSLRLKYILSRWHPGSDCVLIGPRGNGKTALLGWFKKEVDKSGIRCVFANASSAGTLEQFSIQLLPGSQRLRNRVQQIGATVAGSGAQVALRQAQTVFEQELLGACEKNPLIFLLDEAHKVEREAMRALLNASQRVQAEGHPFLVVLAGTPELEREMRKAGATFWERLEQHGINRLARVEARQALLYPFGLSESHNPRVVNEALDECQDYSFFIQSLGQELWNQNSEEITAGSLSRALEGFSKRKRLFYSRRYKELKDAGAIGLAAQAALAFRGGRVNSLAESNLEKAMGCETPAILRDLGYIWQPLGETRYEPGIPSLMGYVLDELG